MDRAPRDPQDNLSKKLRLLNLGASDRYGSIADILRLTAIDS